jgi:hypothetical protein
MVDGCNNIHCYIELPMFIHGNVYIWNDNNTTRFVNMVFNFNIKDHKFVVMGKTSLFSGNRGFPMLCLTFTNINDFNDCVSALEKPLHTQEWGWIYCKIWDSMSVY